MLSLTAGKMNIELSAIAKTQYLKIEPRRCFEVSRCPGLYDPRQGRQVSRDASGFSEVPG